MKASFEATCAYLDSNYLTLEQLAARTGLAPARLDVLIEAGCMPAHSHEATFSLQVYAPINGVHETQERRVRYYHPDLAALASEADSLANAHGLAGAAELLRARHDCAVAAFYADSEGPPVGMAQRAWAAWRDGTLGVCLKRVAIGGILAKVAATELMKAALARAENEGESAVDGAALAESLEQYAAVTGPFGPHERAGSTRALVYEPAQRLAANWRSGAARR